MVPPEGQALTSTVEQHQKSLPSFRNESPTPAMEQPAPRISNDGRAYAAEDGIESIRDGGGRDKDNIDDDRGTAMMAAPEKLGGRDDRDRDEETPVVPSLALGVVSAARDSSSSTREKVNGQIPERSSNPCTFHPSGQSDRGCTTRVLYSRAQMLPVS